MEATTGQHREVDVWKVRWCGICHTFEFDTGSPRGWVKLQGEPPAGATKEYIWESME